MGWVQDVADLLIINKLRHRSNSHVWPLCESSIRTSSKRLSIEYSRSSSIPFTTVPSGLSPLISLSAALVFSFSLSTTAGCSSLIASCCSFGWVFGFVGKAVGADSDEGTLESMVDVGGASLGWSEVEGAVCAVAATTCGWSSAGIGAAGEMVWEGRTGAAWAGAGVSLRGGSGWSSGGAAIL